jgi:hypothetical protein
MQSLGLIAGQSSLFPECRRDLCPRLVDTYRSAYPALQCPQTGGQPTAAIWRILAGRRRSGYRRESAISDIKLAGNIDHPPLPAKRAEAEPLRAAAREVRSHTQVIGRQCVSVAHRVTSAGADCLRPMSEQVGYAAPAARLGAARPIRTLRENSAGIDR